MTDAQFEALQRYVRLLADRLLLSDWEIELKRDAADDDCHAQIEVWNIENRAKVWAGKSYWHTTPARQREILCHELLHCHLDRATRVMSQLSDQLEDNVAVTFAREAHRREIEICTQRFARLLAPTLPLPEGDASRPRD